MAAGRVPGTQGRVRSSGVIYPNKAALKSGTGRTPAGDVVSLSAVEEFNGVTYWRTQSGEYVAAKFVDRYAGSDFEGVELGPQTGLTLPLAFAMSTKNRGADAVVVRAEPNPKANGVRELSRRQPVRSPSSAKPTRSPSCRFFTCPPYPPVPPRPDPPG